MDKRQQEAQRVRERLQRRGELPQQRNAAYDSAPFDTEDDGSTIPVEEQDNGEA